MQEKKKSVIDRLTTDEKEIMNQVLSMMQGKDYILEKDAIENVKHYSKAKTRKTIRKNYVLDKYKLKRIRATKKVKQKYGISGKGYPIIIIYKS